MLKERQYLLPSVQPTGHGLVLLVFWALVFINENVSIMNLNKEHWWNNVNASVRDKVELSLFITRYICSLLIFVLGLKAPGIAQNHDDDYIHLNPDNSVCCYLLSSFFFISLILFVIFLCGGVFLVVISFNFIVDMNFDLIEKSKFIQQESRSTWSNGWKKIRTLAPFLWPKKSIALQLRVIISILLLIAGRVLNVLVPVYNQKIGNFANYADHLL